MRQRPLGYAAGMSIPFNLISASRFTYKAGTGSVDFEVPSGSQVMTLSVRAGAGSATLVIYPGGANQPSPAAAGDTITIVAGSGFAENFLGQLGGGTRFVITDSASFYVSYYQPRTNS